VGLLRLRSSATMLLHQLAASIRFSGREGKGEKRKARSSYTGGVENDRSSRRSLDGRSSPQVVKDKDDNERSQKTAAGSTMYRCLWRGRRFSRRPANQLARCALVNSVTTP